jgi:polyhydroxyalkanoate synthase
MAIRSTRKPPLNRELLRGVQSRVDAGMARVDPMGWGPAVGSVGLRAVKRPVDVAKATTVLAATLARVPLSAVGKLTGSKLPSPVPTNQADKRFADPTWEANPFYFALRQAYFAGYAFVDDLLAIGNTDSMSDAKAAQFVHLMLDMFAPTNFAITNPAVLTKAFQSGGTSLVKGAAYALKDLRHNHGRPIKVDSDAFTVGKNIAATPGKVVYRNDLVELIQYSPQTEQVREIPVLCSPPWINKYYVMDLAPGRSLVEWMVQHGRTVFVLSYRNPDESMREVTLDDYLSKGPLTAIDVITEITGADRVDVVGVCLGGAIGSMMAAHLAADGHRKLGTLTLLNTLLDYSDPGELGTMVDDATLDRLDHRMGETGFLKAQDMGLAFDMLRANDLIFNYVVSRWLQGEPPTAFDILAWNEDSTRMPAAMKSTYLRSLYGDNKLARGEMELSGTLLDLSKVEADVYVVAAINDHIVPWGSSYAATELFSGDVRYVLTSGGHIAGIVNPPGPKAWLEITGGPLDDCPPYPPTAAQWREGATRTSQSWWEDWTPWSDARAGELRTPPNMGSDRYPVLAEGPGSYVLG